MLDTLTEVFPHSVESFNSKESSITNLWSEVDARIQDLIRESQTHTELNLAFDEVLVREAKKIWHAAASLALQLEPHMAQIDSILSDDTSARLLTGYFRTVINYKKQQLKLPRVKHTYFIAGGRTLPWYNTAAVADFLEKKATSLGKTLVVTEYIQSGKSLSTLLSLCAEQNIDTLTACLSLTPGHADESGLPSSLTAYADSIIYGESGDTGVLFDVATQSKGVAHALSPNAAHPRLGSQNFGNKVHGARRMMSIMAQTSCQLLSPDNT